MERYLGRWTPQLFAILRIVAGLLFAMHGTQKLFGFPGENPPVGDELLIAAGVIETGCGLLIALGLLTGWAAFLASGEMATAYFLRHLPHGALPILNHGETPVIYCFLFLYFAAHGAGIWSLDAKAKQQNPE